MIAPSRRDRTIRGVSDRVRALWNELHASARRSDWSGFRGCLSESRESLHLAATERFVGFPTTFEPCSDAGRDGCGAIATPLHSNVFENPRNRYELSAADVRVQLKTNALLEPFWEDAVAAAWPVPGTRPDLALWDDKCCPRQPQRHSCGRARLLQCNARWSRWSRSSPGVGSRWE